MLTVDSLRAAISGVGARLGSGHAELTALDAQLGDGDLGVTLVKAFRALEDIKAGLPDDLGAAFLSMGSAVSKVSSSSFGTLLATALLAIARDLKGRTAADWSELPRLVKVAREAVVARGKANPGDKTALDSLLAIEAALAGKPDAAALRTAAQQAARGALAAFKDKPNRLGRARVYGERSVGIDDPGMAAVAMLLEGL
jgi:dihydroxyacetone kinase-like protein